MYGGPATLHCFSSRDGTVVVLCTSLGRKDFSSSICTSYTIACSLAPPLTHCKTAPDDAFGTSSDQCFRYDAMPRPKASHPNACSPRCGNRAAHKGSLMISGIATRCGAGMKGDRAALRPAW